MVDENDSSTVPKDSISQNNPDSQEKPAGNVFGPNVLPTAKEAMEQARRKARAAKAKTETERTGILFGAREDAIRDATNASKATGIDVRFYRKSGEKVKNDLGYYNHKDGKIYINADIKDPIAFIFGHEMVHHIQSADKYIKFFDTVIRKIQEDGGNIREIRRELADRYAESDVILTSLAQIDQEVVAEYAQKHLFTDAESITSIVGADKESGRKILGFLDKIRAKFGNADVRERVFIDNARKIYARALQETAGSNVKPPEAHGAETAEAKTKTEAAAKQPAKNARQNAPAAAEDGGKRNPFSATVLPTAAERFGTRTAEENNPSTTDAVPLPLHKGGETAEVRAEESTMAEDEKIAPAEENTKETTGAEAVSKTELKAQQGSVAVEAVVSGNLRPEIAGNAALMGMLRDKFGADGTAALTRQIKAEIEKTGTVGRFAVLFSDGGRAVEEALGVDGNTQNSISETQEDGRQYSIKRTKEIPYSNQMDAYYGKRGVLKRDDDIFVMTPDEKLEKIGLENKPIFMLKSNLNKSTREAQTGKSKSAHGIPEHIIRNLQTHIKDAAFAIVQNERLSLISNERVKTQKEENAPLLIGIDPNGAADGKPANEVKTIYGVDNFKEWLCRRAKEGKILVGNVKKAEALLRDVGIQFSQPVAYADDLTEFILAHANKFVNTSNENIQYAITKDTDKVKTMAEDRKDTAPKIELGMDDKTRYEILKNKRLKVANYNAAKTPVMPNDLRLLETKYKKEAASILRRLASDFGVVSTYKNEDIDLEFAFSNGKLGESINKQKKSYQEFGKMLSVFKEVVENAIGIETHLDKYKGTIREDPQLKQTYVLVSVFREGENIYPVRLTVKEFKGNIQNSLHVAVCFEKIKDTISEQALRTQSESTSYPPASPDISLAYLLENVKDEDLKKYIPEGFKTAGSFDGEDISIQYAIAKDTDKAEVTTKESTNETNSLDFWDEWLEKVEEYGAIPKGEKPVPPPLTRSPSLYTREAKQRKCVQKKALCRRKQNLKGAKPSTTA